MNHIQSPDTTDPGIEREIVAKGLTAPRIKPDDLVAAIKDVEYIVHKAQSGQVLRWAVLILQNGFAVTGRPSVAVSPENDDEEIGLKVALENSKQELWPLLGYELKTRLHEASIKDACERSCEGG